MQPMFEQLFTCGLNRDYENTWEWLEGHSARYKGHIDFAREHDWSQGCYDKPIILKAKFNNEINVFATFKEIAKELSQALHIAIYYGELDVDEKYNYSFSTYGVMAPVKVKIELAVARICRFLINQFRR